MRLLALAVAVPVLVSSRPASACAPEPADCSAFATLTHAVVLDEAGVTVRITPAAGRALPELDNLQAMLAPARADAAWIDMTLVDAQPDALLFRPAAPLPAGATYTVHVLNFECGHATGALIVPSPTAQRRGDPRGDRGLAFSVGAVAFGALFGLARRRRRPPVAVP